MPILTTSQNLYKKLQKQYSRKINLDLKRINLALEKLNNVHKDIKNPINIIGSDGKYSTLKSLQYFIEENKEKVSAFTSPHLYDVRHRFWLKNKFINIGELKKNIKTIEKLKVKLTLFELLTLAYYISASKLKKGHLITKDDLLPLRPIGTNSFQPFEKALLIGKKLKKDIQFGENFTKDILL